jgi:hypothetical protein
VNLILHCDRMEYGKLNDIKCTVNKKNDIPMERISILTLYIPEI